MTGTEQPLTLDRLGQLAVRLGCRPARETIPPHFWPPSSLAPGGNLAAALIGWRGGLPWYGVEAPMPHRLAAAMARSLVRRGDLAALLVADPETGNLSMAVTFEPVPVLRIHPAEDPGLVAECFERLTALPEDQALGTAARIAGILATRGIGVRFFAAFERQLERVASSISLRRPEDRHGLALLLLNRILFLYFVQSKGWLNGEPDFLRVRVDDCLVRRKGLDRHLLRPLFFGTLNRDIGARSATARHFGRVPFLNGGLFEPHVLERQWKGSLSNSVWRDIFDDLFERFHFTAAEGKPGAIAPDMLGRVFEGVMAPLERRSSGTFYTPPGLVRALLDESLAALLASRLGVPADHALDLLAAPDPLLAPIIGRIRLLDPAVGSGAFLLQALERFTCLASSSAAMRPAVRRSILQSCLFGVDINPTAVRLTELRLWLALVAEDSAAAPDAVAPLPNLDCLVRQGDSLADPLGLVARMSPETGAMGGVLASLRRTFTTATGNSKRDTARALRRAEQAAMRSCLQLAEGRLEGAVAETLLEARSPDLFGKARGADRRTCRRLRDLRSQLAPVRRAMRRLEREGTVGWFQYESHFADIFQEQGGFDMVVGNPPWVRAETLDRQVRGQLAGRYAWWRSGGTATGYRHQPDLAVAFLQRSHELAREGGVVGLLVPSKIASAGYATVVRAALAQETTIHAACEVEPRAASFDATVYPLALVTTRRRAPKNHAVRVALNQLASPTVPQADLGAAPWILRGGGAAGIIRQLSERFPPLGGRHRIQLGAKTGANGIYLAPPRTVEPSLIRPGVRGRDVRAFSIGGTVPLLWPCAADGSPLARLPAGAESYLRAHRSELTSRADYRAGPYWMIYRTAAASSGSRVIWADLARTIAATLLPPRDRRIPLNTCYVIRTDIDSAMILTAWLNSRWIRGVARHLADPASGGFARFNARTVGALPLLLSLANDQDLAAVGRRALEGSINQADLDELAAPHLDLTHAQLAIIARLA